MTHFLCVTFFLCLPCAILRPQTPRQLIRHAIMFGGPSACGCL